MGEDGIETWHFEQENINLRVQYQHPQLQVD